MKYDGLVSDLTAAAATLEDALGKDSPELIHILRPLAFSLIGQNDHLEAARVLKRLIALYRASGQADGELSMLALKAFANGGSGEEALALYRELAAANPGATATEGHELTMTGADCLIKTGNDDGAEVLLAAHRQGLMAEQAPWSLLYGVASKRLSLSRARDDRAASIACAREALSLLEQGIGTENPALLQDLDCLIALLRLEDEGHPDLAGLKSRRRDLKKRLDG
ncbi:MAG: hypothetical protein KC777_27050 [Cyanobacteria bacterium HKST-UBA02]|nr:hypothetical protein [Cyanobacteria bacterium HKST-UBA02]